jgi:hypothetical protein
MLVRRRASLLAVLLGCSGMLVLGSLRLDAQEPSAEKSVAEKKSSDRSRRVVPDFFGQIGLSQDQKEEIYKIRAKHVERIAALQKQIDDIKAEEMKECEAKLSESQKLLLEVRRRASAEAKKAAAAEKIESRAVPKSGATAKSDK